MGTYHIWTIGCQMNKADSERLASALELAGMDAAAKPADADVVVLNSCVVRQSAEDKVVGTLGMMKSVKRKRPGQVLALMGCMVGAKTKELEDRFPQVDVFMRPQQFAPLLDLSGRSPWLGYGGVLGRRGARQPVGQQLRTRDPRLRPHVHFLYHTLSPRPPGKPSH